MRRKTIYPAIDLRAGKVVRLVRGDFNKQTTYSDNPAKVAERFCQLGADWLHVVNLDGALDGSLNDSANLQAVKAILEVTVLYATQVQVGGGVRSLDDVTTLVQLGVRRVIVGTLAVGQPSTLAKIVENYPNYIAVGLDVLEGSVRTKGWVEDSKLNLSTVAQRISDIGVKTLVVTDISRDGTGEGLNLDLYQSLRQLIGPTVNLIASGGVKDLTDVTRALEVCEGVIVGNSLYNGSISSDQLQKSIYKFSQSNLTVRIIPCLDVKEGRVVKGVNFVKLRDSGDPVDLARLYNRQGADELIFLDISATIEGRESMIDVIRSVAEEVRIPFAVGGGVRTVEDIGRLIKAGAEKVSINSAAIQNPELVTQGSKKFGSQCIVVAIDAKESNGRWEVFTHGGRRSTGIDAVEWAKEVVRRGAGELLVTSMDRDGTKVGYDLNLIRAITSVVQVPVISSGGAGTLPHFAEAVEAGAEAVLAASLFHYGEFKVREVKSYLGSSQYPVRWSQTTFDQ